MYNRTRYYTVCLKLYSRYTKGSGVVWSNDHGLTKYANLCNLAAVKYLGCNADKLKG